MMPQAGAEYVYLREIYGRPAAFLTGWTSFFVGFSAPAAASAVACAAYLHEAGLLPGAWAAQKGFSAAIVVALTAFHYTGVRRGSRLQSILAAFVVCVLVGLIFWGFLRGAGNWQFIRSSTANFPAAGRASQFGLALLWAMFAYSGWNASAYLAEEVERPSRTLPLSLLLGTLAIGFLYFAVNAFIFFAAPASALSGQVAVGAVAVRHAFGAHAATGLALAVSLMLFATVSAYIVLGPRVYFAMARDGLFFRFAARVHPRYETPAFSVAIQGACALLMILTGTFEQLLTYIGFALGIFPWMAVCGVILLRRKQPARERPYRVFGYPVVPLFYLAATAYIMGAALMSRPLPSLLAIVTVAAGLPIYFLMERQKRSRSTTDAPGLGQP
jgi:basic amino acid/polyamine antiporter, APA family